MRSSPFVVGAFVAAVVTGCATSVSDKPGLSHPDASDAASTPLDPVQLALTPFWGIELTDAGATRGSVSLGGVHVCVAFRRGYSEAWGRFVPVKPAPCADSVAGNGVDAPPNVVIDGVPARSELLLTAELDGYIPAVLTATTSDRSAAPGSDSHGDNLIPAMGGDEARRLGVDSGHGTLFVFAIVPAANPTSLDVATYVQFFGGAHVSVAPEGSDAGVAASYFKGGVTVLDASATLPSATLPGSDGTSIPGAAVQVPAGEYAVHVSHPNAVCTAASGYADEDYDFIRAPVLAGHVTEVVASCSCLQKHASLDCIPVDGGADAW